jgi:hypothetical protein
MHTVGAKVAFVLCVNGVVLLAGARRRQRFVSTLAVWSRRCLTVPYPSPREGSVGDEGGNVEPRLDVAANVEMERCLHLAPASASSRNLMVNVAADFPSVVSVVWLGRSDDGRKVRRYIHHNLT